jgi:DNA-binding MarR family transcriptional regulator
MRLINSLEERDLVGAYQGIDFSGRAYTYYHLTALGRRIAASITRYQPTPGQNETEFGHRLNSRLIYDHNLLPVIRNVNATVPARKSTEQLIQEAEATNVVDHMPEVFALVERLRELEQQIKKGNTKP